MTDDAPSKDAPTGGPPAGDGVPRIVLPVVVMGVSGSGKSTIGTLLAERLGVDFLEGDSLHPPQNVAKMAAGRPLDDADRRPWLALIGQWLADARTLRPAGGVAACSALARRYRDQLRELCPSVWFLHLDAERDLVAERVAGRHGPFMPATLVDSQLQTLESLAADEAGLRLPASLPAEQIIEAALAALAAQPERRPHPPLGLAAG